MDRDSRRSHGSVDNGTVPFTLAHAAAALPFRRTRLIPSALVVGTFAPDFEFFLRLAPHGSFSHSLRGVFVFTLPAALVVLWLFHRCVKIPLVLVLPDSMQRRLDPYLGRFNFFPATRFALIVLSILVGIATHILWDSFTHPGTWLYYHWALLSHRVHIPAFGFVRYCRVLQYVCSVAGIAILWAWAHRWYRTAKPASRNGNRQLSAAGRVILLAVVPSVALAGGMLRAVFEAHAHRENPFEAFIGAAVVATISLAWWQFVFCSLFVKLPFFSKRRVYSAAN